MDSEKYLIKLKQLGMSNEMIAKKMGVSPATVESTWQTILAQASALVDNGLLELQTSFNSLAQMYESLGESLKVQGFMLGNVATKEEILKVIQAVLKDVGAHDGFSDYIAEKLMTSFIILRPYITPTPKQQMEADVKKN